MFTFCDKLAITNEISLNLGDPHVKWDQIKQGKSRNEFRIKLRFENIQRDKEFEKVYVKVRFVIQDNERTNYQITNLQWKFRMNNEYDIGDEFKHISELEYLPCSFGSPSFSTVTCTTSKCSNSDGGVTFSGNTNVYLTLYPTYYQNSLKQIFYYSYVPQLSKVEHITSEVNNGVEVTFFLSNDDTSVRYDTIYSLVTYGQALEYSVFAWVIWLFFMRGFKRWIPTNKS